MHLSNFHQRLMASYYGFFELQWYLRDLIFCQVTLTYLRHFLDLQTLNAGSKLYLDLDILMWKCQSFNGFCKKCYLFVTFFCCLLVARTQTKYSKRLKAIQNLTHFPFDISTSRLSILVFSLLISLNFTYSL